jgi:Protein of unknown function (DUF5663)
MNLPVDQQNIIALLGIESLPDERKTQILEKIITLVQKRLLVRVFDSLIDSLQDELGKLLESGNVEATEIFLEQHVPQMGEWAQEETNNIKTEMGEWLKQVKE